MVNVNKGIHATILAKLETTWGTPVVPDRELGAITSFNQNDTQATEEVHALGQSKPQAIPAGKYTPKGSIEINMTNGRILEYALYGGTTTHADTSTDCTHTFVYADDLPSVTIEESFNEATDEQHLWAGVYFQNPTISVAMDDYLKLRTDWIAKNVDVSGATATAAQVPTATPLRGFQAALDIGGSTIDYVQSWELSFNRNSNLLWGLGSRVPAAAGSNILNCDWRATVGFVDSTEHERLLGGTTASSGAPSSFATTFTADNGISLGSGELSLSIGLTSCQVESINKTVDLGDFILYDIAGKGILGAGEMVDQVLQAAW